MTPPAALGFDRAILPQRLAGGLEARSEGRSLAGDWGSQRRQRPSALGSLAGGPTTLARRPPWLPSKEPGAAVLQQWHRFGA